MLNNKKLQLIQEATAAFPGTPVNSAIWYYLKDRFTGITVAELISKYLRDIRWAYNFDGVDDRGQLQFRAINPEGDIDIEFRTGPTAVWGGVDRAIVSQCLTATYSGTSGKEFTLYWNASLGLLQGLVGGVYLTSCVGTEMKPNTKYRWQLQGQRCRAWVNDILVHDNSSIARGTAREPSAITVVGAQTHGGANTFRAFCSGVFFDVRINGVLWPMNSVQQTVLLPSPTGLGAELITQSVLENPFLKGTQWTYLGGGRWQYIGDGQGELTFLSNAQLPEACFIEYEVESYQLVSGTGGMRISPTATNFFGDRLFTGTGKFRAFYTAKPASVSFTRNNAGTQINCVIKNISFKPLWVAGATELVTNGNFSNGTTGWTADNGTISVVSGQGVLTTTAGQNSRFAQTLSVDAGAYYEISCDLVALSGVTSATLNFRRGAAGAFTTILETSRTSAGRMSFIAMATGTDVMVQIRGDATNAGTVTVDNISVRKLDSLCNPMVASNFNPDRWQEVQP